MIPYIGGKYRLTNWIISNFPENYQKMSYCEVFGGAGWVLLKKDQSNLEIYNELNSVLTNLFRVVRDNYHEFKFKANWSLHSRNMFLEACERLKNDNYLGEVDEALYYAIKQAQSFSGTGNSWGYIKDGTKKRSSMWLPFLNRLEDVNARLQPVQIENLDFEDAIKKYDSENTLFYLDPPYVETEHYYKNSMVNFTLKDHERLADILKQIKGKFILSYYDHLIVKKLYNGFRIEVKQSVKSSYGVTKDSKNKTRPRSTELLIMNY